MLHGYLPLPSSNSLQKHKTRRTVFALCVDNFGVKYFYKSDAEHLTNTLEKYYIISVDSEVKNYCGLNFKWHYTKGNVDVSMPGYIKKALQKCQHDKPLRPQYAQHCWTKPANGK
eukprot:5058955-Ditylum_brightwellii.AAC.1